MTRDQESQALRVVLNAITASKKRRACSRAVAERRGWKPVFYTGTTEINRFLTDQQWFANLAHMLDGSHPYQYGLCDHFAVVEVLGFDPLREEQFDTAA